MNEDFLIRKLQQRKEMDALRQLRPGITGIDFCSNDYLGIVRNRLIRIADENELYGSTGSRLISGNYPLIEEVEKQVAAFHEAEAALIFNSGYDANTGLLSSVPQRTDTVLYDQLIHASIRDGIRLSTARSFSFDHNDMEDLEKKLQAATGNIFIVTESVFSMDGDTAPLEEISALCREYGGMLIVDEAHATGVIGYKGEGLVQKLGLQSQCFARIHTFGKAAGCHGAAVLGSPVLREYLINFCRSFIYTTGLPASAVKAIGEAYTILESLTKERENIQRLVTIFKKEGEGLHLCKSDTPIQGIIIPGNEQVKSYAARLFQSGFDIRPILYPTVPRNQERLRIVLHAFNTEDQLLQMMNIIRG